MAQSTPSDEVAKAAEDRTILMSILIDKSGSMMPIQQATIEGFNDLKAKQLEEEGNAFASVTFFDTRVYQACDAIPVRELPDLDVENYQPGGSTALYDAIGQAISTTDAFVSANKPDQVLFVIITDGEENASRELDGRQVYELIQDRQNNAGYEFMYLGANQDSFAVGSDMGMRRGRTLDYEHSVAGAKEAYARASRNVAAYRRKGQRHEPQFFAAELERMGEIDAATWKRMSPEERQRHINGGDSPQA